jgi:hypothetical protein
MSAGPVWRTYPEIALTDLVVACSGTIWDVVTRWCRRRSNSRARRHQSGSMRPTLAGLPLLASFRFLKSKPGYLDP